MGPKRYLTIFGAVFPDSDSLPYHAKIGFTAVLRFSAGEAGQPPMHRKDTNPSGLPEVVYIGASEATTKIFSERKGGVGGIAVHHPVPVGFLDDTVFFGPVYMHEGIFLRSVLIYSLSSLSANVLHIQNEKGGKRCLRKCRKETLPATVMKENAAIASRREKKIVR